MGTRLLFPLPSPVLEEPQRFMRPDANEALDWQSLQGPECLEDAPYPTRHLSGGVDVVGLRVLCEPLLWAQTCNHL